MILVCGREERVCDLSSQLRVHVRFDVWGLENSCLKNRKLHGQSQWQFQSPASLFAPVKRTGRNFVALSVRNQLRYIQTQNQHIRAFRTQNPRIHTKQWTETAKAHWNDVECRSRAGHMRNQAQLHFTPPWTGSLTPATPPPIHTHTLSFSRNHGKSHPSPRPRCGCRPNQILDPPPGETPAWVRKQTQHFSICLQHKETDFAPHRNGPHPLQISVSHFYSQWQCFRTCI